MTNDSRHPRHILSMNGVIKVFADINPAYVRLIGPYNKEVKRTLIIKKLKKYPFNITEIKTKNGKNISYALEPFENETESGYRLNVINTRKEKGRYSDMLMLHTDSTIKKIIKISVYGNISNAMGNNKIKTPGKKS